jgi:vacuolar-type H+-ATPase subunit D/Vma8
MENIRNNTKSQLIFRRKHLEMCKSAEDLMTKRAKMLHIKLRALLRAARDKEEAIIPLRADALEKRQAAGPPTACFPSGSTAGDEAAVAERLLYEAEAELALLREKAAAAEKALKQAARRAAALSHVLIPRTHADIKRISAALEEKERDESSLPYQPV